VINDTHFSQLGRITLCGKETRSRSTGKLLTFTDNVEWTTCSKCKIRHAERAAKIAAAQKEIL
jgi:hypothetical protein